MHNGRELTLPIDEQALQFPGGLSSSQTLDVVIGVDWGTSSTKVAIQTPYHSGRRTYAVDFSRLTRSANPYLLPSTLFISSEGQAVLRSQAGSESYAHLKLQLLSALATNPAETENIQVMACAFLASVLRYARHWFLHTQNAAYRQYKLRWSFNLGMPSDGYQESTIVEVYRRIAKAAWLLSVQPGSITLSDSRTLLIAPAQSLEEVEVLPEVAAQVVGYARSHTRRDGMHVLVDIGAMTVDVASFNLFEHQEEGEDHYRFYTAEVQPIGAYKLHEQRVLQVLEALGDESINSETYARLLFALKRLENPLHPIPQEIDRYLSVQLQTESATVALADVEIAKGCRTMVHKQLHDLRKNKYPNAPAWKNGLPLFLCGGGHQIEAYRNALTGLSDWWLENTDVAPFEVKELPVPENLIAEYLEPDAYHRLSVAYGLSFPVDDIGIVRPPGMVSSTPKAPVRERRGLHEDTKELT